jgi:multidrug transporter EmrE-like cation transporter
MLYIIIVLFALTAVVGFIILKNWLTTAETSRTIVYLHGIFAAVALVLLAVYAFQNPTHYPMVSIILFVIGALIGFYMFAEDLKKRFSPTWLAIVHALFGVAGFLLLLFFVFG